MKHTKGKWQAMHTQNGIYNIVCGKAQIASVYDFAELGSNALEIKERQQANAKLMAAAPDMLEACLLLKEFDNVETYSKEWEELAEKHLKITEQAIKKATE